MPHRVISTLALLSGLSFAASATAAERTPGETFTDCETCPEMVVIPPGEFTMGSERGEFVLNEIRPETPVHQRTIRYAFAAGKTEVTNAQFGEFIAATGYRPSAACSKWLGQVEFFGGDWTDPDYGRPPTANEPVVCVSWHDAKAFTTWMSGKTGERYRLLSEAEWEYVARDGTQSTWAWGENSDLACKTGNVFDESGAQTSYAKEHSSWEPVKCDDGFGRVAPVGSFPANSFGLHDLGGNVWEWNEDCSLWLYDDEDVNEEPNQVPGHCDRRSVKGGSWFSMISRHRPAFRGRDPENLASHIFGFRLARDLAQ